MTHTSGIADNWDVLDEHDLYGKNNPVKLGDFLRGYLDPGGDEHDEDASFSEDAPGEAEDYSNAAVALLGHLVERLSSQDFAKYCESRIFKPLGMTSTTWIVSEVDAPRIAFPYIDRNQEDADEDEEEDDEEDEDEDEGDEGSDAPDWYTKGLYSTPDYPDGQLCSTAPDLARFFSAVMGWGEYARSPLLSESTRKVMFGRHRLARRAGLSPPLDALISSGETGHSPVGRNQGGGNSSFAGALCEPRESRKS